MIRAFLFLTLLAVAACSRGADDGTVAVSVIGEPPAILDPNRRPLDTASAALLGATAQGLVRFDAAGQIEPGLAMRWDVSDDGLYYTFRIVDGAGIDAEEAARRLRAAIASGSRNPLRPVLGAIDEIVAVTPEVIEIRLRSPRPNLLQLLAQPELALLDGNAGTGPFRVVGEARPGILLAPIAAEEDEDGEIRGQVRLTGERASLAVAHFMEGAALAVIGGDFANLAIARAAERPAAQLHFDPAPGLLGLIFVRNAGFVGVAENRRALAMAIDRERLTNLLATPAWRATATLVPLGIADLPAPARPDWIDTDVARRRAFARAATVAWLARSGQAARVRVALPKGPGARLLFASIRLDWAAMGVAAEVVAREADADVKLIDLVAPSDIASWYLRRFTCDRSPVCSEQADAALEAARAAPTLAERTARLADADARLAEVVAYIPLAQPLRWSLVAPELDGWQDNPRAIHPLNHLRAKKK